MVNITTGQRTGFCWCWLGRYHGRSYSWGLCSPTFTSDTRGHLFSSYRSPGGHPLTVLCSAKQVWFFWCFDYDGLIFVKSPATKPATTTNSGVTTRHTRGQSLGKGPATFLTIQQSNVAMEHCPLIDDSPTKTSIFFWYFAWISHHTCI